MKPTTFFILVTVFCLGNSGQAHAQKNDLELVATIQMPNVTGRIDHLAFDSKRQLIFVAALANNTIEVADLKSKKVIHSIKNRHKPQGIIFVPGNNVVVVANGDTGECDIFDAETFQKISSIKLSGDADNVRLDPIERKIYVGYGDGGIAIIDATSYKVLSEIKLSGHPESFQLDKVANKIFVNVPDSKQIEIIDLKVNPLRSTWKMTEEKNYPMALDETNHRLFIGFRQPSKLLIFDTETGHIISTQDIDGDVDDIFFNSATRQVYLSCGDGKIDIFRQGNANTYNLEDKVVSRPGARTCLFIPELNQLVVASPLRDNNTAALLVYKCRDKKE
jgi:DNA-binding beta-propeller fold protein YncE